MIDNEYIKESKISDKAKERFCKDCNINIRLFQDPYFMERLRLYDPYYNSLEKWDNFTRALKKFPCEQDYFEEYNRIKDRAIEFIKTTPGYQRLIDMDWKGFEPKHKGLPSKDIFKTINDGKYFINIDMKKANFSALHAFSPDIFGNAKTWEGFIQRFTDIEHIINSKYIRQVIMGNCNPKRQVAYEKHFMDKILTDLEEAYPSLKDHIVFFSNDEIVFDVSSMNKEDSIQIGLDIHNSVKKQIIPLRVEYFSLHKIHGTKGYVKNILMSEGKMVSRQKLEFVCLNNYMMPFVLRYFAQDELTENDKIFYYEGLLSKFVSVPEISCALIDG